MNISIKEETLGQRIRAQRIRLGMTQEELAEEICLPRSTISAYENDKVDIKSSAIIELSEHLDIVEVMKPIYNFKASEEHFFG